MPDKACFGMFSPSQVMALLRSSTSSNEASSVKRCSQPPPSKAKNAEGPSAPFKAWRARWHSEPLLGTVTEKKEECPEWIATKLNERPKSVKSLEIFSGFDSSFKTVARYLELVAVDADGPPPEKIDIFAEDPKSPGPQRRSCLYSNISSRHFTGNVDDDDRTDYIIGLGSARARTSDGEDIYICHLAHEKPERLLALAMGYKLVLYAAHKKSLKNIVEDARAWEQENEARRQKATKGQYQLFTLSMGTSHAWWEQAGSKDARSIDSIFLQKEMKEEIIADFKKFHLDETEKWYARHGLPYRRNYLFYGPPGTGKTSMIRCLAGELGFPAYFIVLSDGMKTQALIRALRKVPSGALMVLEDVDSLFSRERESKITHSTLTFSGLLNALDGMIAKTKVVTVMTTNHIESLDPALIRAGRVDRRFEFPYPNKKQLQDLFKSYYPDCDPKLSEDFVKKIVERKEKSARSIATLQQLFLRNRENTAEECLKDIPSFFESFYPNDEPFAASRIYN